MITFNDINGDKSFLGKEIREWCKDNHDSQSAEIIYEKYYGERAEFKPNDKVYYYIKDLSRGGHKLIRDLEKSPRPERKG